MYMQKSRPLYRNGFSSCQCLSLVIAGRILAVAAVVLVVIAAGILAAVTVRILTAVILVVIAAGILVVVHISVIVSHSDYLL